MDRFRRLGLQKRIMLYVTVGLALLFGLVAFLGLGAIDEATQLVYEERLTTAHTTAGILERDFGGIAADVVEADRAVVDTPAGSIRPGTAERLLEHFTRTDQYLFFRVSGIWLVDPDGRLVDEAGAPAGPGTGVPVDSGLVTFDGHYAVLRAVAAIPGAFPMAAVSVRLTADPAAPIVVVHTVSVNSSAPYVPASHGRPGSTAGPAPSSGSSEQYHLEVVDRDGMAVLGIGEDERPGRQSTHFPVIRRLVEQHAAAALLHEPGPGDRFEPHVMAVVPLANGPFYVVLEQPVDVALALPLLLRGRLVLLTAIGFLAALAVAWVTTRHVVKPTEQLTAAAERMAGGDLARPIDVTAQDEVGTLAESLDVMRQRLKAAYEEVERTNRELEARVAERTARLGQVLRTTISAQEEERQRLARELHDETAQTLAALSIALDRARDGLDGASPQTLEQIAEAKRIAAGLLAETRRLILGLRPSVLDDMGLIAAIRWHCETVLGERGVDVTIDGNVSAARLSGHVEVSLFRIIQEAINNIARHAQANHAWIRLALEQGLARVVVRDDGRGFDVERTMAASGPLQSIGLLGMQERVALLGGHMEVHSGAAEGTEIVVEVPISQEAQ